MIRGEYVLIRGDEQIVIPNQFTIFGAQLMLRAAFWGSRPALKLGLSGRNPDDTLQLAGMQEPSGANGYLRINLPMDDINWPIIGSINGESFVESREFTFELTGAVDVPVNRFFITDGVQVVSVSSAFKSGLQLYSAPITTKYRLYLR